MRRNRPRGAHTSGGQQPHGMDRFYRAGPHRGAARPTLRPRTPTLLIGATRGRRHAVTYAVTLIPGDGIGPGARGRHARRARGHRHRLRLGRPAGWRGDDRRRGDATSRARHRLDPRQRGRDQGTDHDAGRLRLPLRQCRTAPGARALRQRPAGPQHEGRREPLRRDRPHHRAREHRGPLRRHRAPRRSRTRRRASRSSPAPPASGSRATRSSTRCGTAAAR